MRDRPYFLWDTEATEADLRAYLDQADPRLRAQWQGCVLREARYGDVWKYVTLEQVLRDWSYLEPHLGRSRPFWTYLIEGWRRDGLLPAA